MTNTALHTFVYKGRHDIKAKLEFPSTIIKTIPSKVDIDLPIENSKQNKYIVLCYYYIHLYMPYRILYTYYLPMLLVNFHIILMGACH